MTSLHKLPNRKSDLSRANGLSRVEGSDESQASSTLDARTTALVVIAIGVTIFLLQFMQALLAPMAFGILLFFVLDPAVDLLERQHIPRFLAAAI